MIRRPPRSTLFPYTTLFRSPAFEGDAEMLIVPGAAGEIGVLARHAPLVAMLKAGSTRVHLGDGEVRELDRKSTRLNSSHLVISYAVFCLKKKRDTIAISPSC